MKLKRLYSIRMRAAQGGDHELGGKHISGGEKLTKQRQVQQSVNQLLKKARRHSKGQPDFIQIIIEEVVTENIEKIIPKQVTTINKQCVTEALNVVKEELMHAGVSTEAIHRAITYIQEGPAHRGAIIMNAASGVRIDNRGISGIRVSRVDWEDSDTTYSESEQRIREARAIAAKVAHASPTIAELCWSDDPDYQTGYVSSRLSGYVRIFPLKQLGDERGGRVFFVKEPLNLEEYISYLELMPVLLQESWE